MSKPVVTIIGRPNVGKSTLFNRIAQKRIAIVENFSGITRDRVYADGEWLGREFRVIDTGGIEFEDDEHRMMPQIIKQVNQAISEASVLVFVVDGRDGLTSTDMEVAGLLRRSRKPIILAVNKVENPDKVDLYEFYRLGIGEPVAISAAHGKNTGDLLDEIIAHFPKQQEEVKEPEDIVRIAVVGKPNVGKSSLVNKILGEERVIVSNIPGTTRDAIDVYLEKDGNNYVLIDTAGMRKKKKVEETVEYYSVLRSLNAIEGADVVLMLIDAENGVTEQDKKIAGYAHEAGRGMLIVVNKWDLIEKDNNTTKQFIKSIREELSFLSYAPILFISAKTGQRVNKIFELVNFVADQHAQRISTGLLNEVIQEAIVMNRPPNRKGQALKILYATQVAVKPPRIVIFVNDPERLHFSYERYLENKVREAFGFEGTPVWFSIKKREKEDK